MRTAPLLVLLVALVALAPTSGAAAIELVDGRVAESLVDDARAIYRFPVVFHETGDIYAKVLPTEGNAVHDGRASNGSVQEERGWRVAFAIERADGTRVELGTYADGTMTPLTAVMRDENATFEARVYVPADAAQHGDAQRVYVALAFRPPTGAGGGAGSGGTADEARALTLIVHLDPDAATPPVDDDGQDHGADAEVPPVSPIDDTGWQQDRETIIVVGSAGFPAWLAGVIVAALALVALALGAVAALLYLVWRELRAARADALAPHGQVEPQEHDAVTIHVQQQGERPFTREHQK